MKKIFSVLLTNGYSSTMPVLAALDTDLIATILSGHDGGYAYLGDKVCRIIMRDGTRYHMNCTFEDANDLAKSDCRQEILSDSVMDKENRNRVVQGVNRRAIVELPFMIWSEYIIDGTKAEIFSDMPLKITDEIEVYGFNAQATALDGSALDYAELSALFKQAAYSWYLEERRFIVMPFSFMYKKDFTPFIKRRFKDIEFRTSISFPEPPKVSQSVKVKVFITCKGSFE